MEPAFCRAEGRLQRKGQERQPKLCLHILELNSYNVDVALLGINNNNGNPIFIGNQKTAQFFDERPKLMEEMYAFHSQGIYLIISAKATGKESAFPYKMVMKGALTVLGLPESILPLKNISTFGEKNLKLIRYFYHRYFFHTNKLHI